jgi:hypothetical protein
MEMNASTKKRLTDLRTGVLAAFVIPIAVLTVAVITLCVMVQEIFNPKPKGWRHP